MWFLESCSVTKPNVKHWNRVFSNAVEDVVWKYGILKISLTAFLVLLFLTQWMKEESNRCLITALTQGSQRMANGSALTSGEVVLGHLKWWSLGFVWKRVLEWVNVLFIQFKFHYYDMQHISVITLSRSNTNCVHIITALILLNLHQVCNFITISNVLSIYQSHG